MAKRKAKNDLPSSNNGYELFDAHVSGLPMPLVDAVATGHPSIEDFVIWLDSLSPVQQHIFCMNDMLQTELCEGQHSHNSEDHPLSMREITEGEHGERLDDFIQNSVIPLVEKMKREALPKALEHVVNELRDITGKLTLALERGETSTAMRLSMILGYRLCQLEVLPHDDAAKIGKQSLTGAAKGKASKLTKAAQRRDDTQQAVRDRWIKNPKLSLATIQAALAKLTGTPFGGIRTVEKNTAGMKSRG